MNKQQLAAKIWESANKNAFQKSKQMNTKDYILGFIFYKFLSEKEVKYLKANDWTDEYLPELTEEDTDTVGKHSEELGIFYFLRQSLFNLACKRQRFQCSRCS